MAGCRLHKNVKTDRNTPALPRSPQHRLHFVGVRCCHISLSLSQHTRPRLLFTLFLCVATVDVRSRTAKANVFNLLEGYWPRS